MPKSSHVERGGALRQKMNFLSLFLTLSLSLFFFVKDFFENIQFPFFGNADRISGIVYAPHIIHSRNAKL